MKRKEIWRCKACGHVSDQENILKAALKAALYELEQTAPCLADQNMIRLAIAEVKRALDA